MRNRSSSTIQENKEGMDIDGLNKLKDHEEPHLSSAYIRSLVKQLTSSRTKGTNMKDADAFVQDQNTTKFSGGETENHPPTRQTQQPPPQQHKKQVRRRLHTSRPYQERLLNMAEARREIVTALKVHRAAMKKANEQKQQEDQQQQRQQQQELSLPVQFPSPPCFEQDGKIKTRRNPRIYPSNTNNFPNYLDNFSYTTFSNPPPPPTYPFSWNTTPILPATVPENLNFPLPNQPLGLNLNFHELTDIDTSLYYNTTNPSSVCSSTSPSSSSSPSLEVLKSPEGQPAAVCDGGGLHQVMDDEEMAEIRSIGEQHQMEWDDTMNLVTSAWWFKFLKNMELDPEVKAEDIDGYHPFDQVMEFPAWLNANDGCLEQHFNDYFSKDYYHDPDLPCMDIGEIEGMDGEWLA